MIQSLISKELRSYFNSPIAYIAITFFLVVSAVVFFIFQEFFVRNVATLRGYFGTMPLILVFLVPALTMRSWAEEKKQGTYELLLSLPFREITLVMGKFLGAMILFGIMLLLTIPVPIMVSMFGNFEIGEIIGEYVGLLLLGAASISVGIFISAVSRNQISAFIVTALVLLIFILIGNVSHFVSLGSGASQFIRWFSFDVHYRSFLRGIIDSRDVIFYSLMIVLFQYATIRAINMEKGK